MADSRVQVEWTGSGLAFTGRADNGPVIHLDSEGELGPSPMQAVLLGLAGCMGVDVVMILEKGRVPITSLSVDVEGDRNEETPRYFRAVRMTYRIAGPGAEHEKRVQRAVDLSRDRYCSVLHTLRPDLDLDIRVEIV